MAIHGDSRKRVGEFVRLLAAALDHGSVDPFRSGDGSLGAALGEGAEGICVLFSRRPNALMMTLRRGWGPEGAREVFPLYSDGDLFPEALAVYHRLASGAGTSTGLLEDALHLLRSRASSPKVENPDPVAEVKVKGEEDGRKTFFQVLLGDGTTKVSRGLPVTEPDVPETAGQEHVPETEGAVAPPAVVARGQGGGDARADSATDDNPAVRQGRIDWPNNEWRELYGRLRELSGA